MLEILVIRFVAGKVGDIAGGKGYNPILFTALFIIMWFGGEITGFVIGLNHFESKSAAYGLAIIFAFSGAIVAFLIAALVPSGEEPRRRSEEFDQWGNRIRRRPRGQERAPKRRPRPSREDDEDEDDRPRRRPRDDDEDDDRNRRRVRPRSEGDEAPRRRRRDEDEEEPPRRRRPRYDD